MLTRILQISLLACGFMQMRGAEFIGSAIALKNKDLAIQLIAAANLAPADFGYKKATKAFGNIDKAVEGARENLKLALGGSTASVGEELSESIKNLAKGSKVDKARALSQVVAGKSGEAILTGIKEGPLAPGKLDGFRKAVLDAANDAVK